MSLASARYFLLVQLAALFLTAGLLRAQAPGTGAIMGVVHDPSGLTVANAAVSTVNESTDGTRSAVTNSAGAFSVTMLTPGTYTVTVSVSGFEANVLHSVRVVVGETSSLEFRLAMQKVGVTLQVAADAEIAQTQSSTLGRAVQEEAIRALPLANRNYTQILGLSPGVVVALPDATALGRNTQNVTSDGAKTTSNNIQFNGVDANNLSQDSAADDGEEVGTAIPAPDAIQEFKVQTANYDASYGRGAGELYRHLPLRLHRDRVVEHGLNFFPRQFVDVADLVGVHEAGIAHHVAAVGQIDGQHRAASIFHRRRSMMMQMFVAVGLDVAAGKTLFQVLSEFRVNRHQVFEVPVLGAVLDHPDLAVAFDDLGFNLSHFFVHQHVDRQMAVENLLPNFRHAPRTK